VTLVTVGSKDGVFGDYGYTSKGNPVSFHAPITAGDYELRYQSDRVKGVAARRPIRVILSEIALGGPREVPAGQPFEIPWHGPDGPSDYITIVKADAADNTYTSFAYTKNGSPARLHAPIEAGEYELRYQSDREKGVFARRGLLVKPVEVVLDARAEVVGGESFEIAWRGPNGDSDYLTIVAAGAPPGIYKEYAYTKGGSPLSLHAPLESGSYELRYQSDREKGIFARMSIEVASPSITLKAPGEVLAGSTFEVQWTGPDGNQDYITIVKKGAPAGAYLHYVYTRKGLTVTLRAPEEVGEYEVRYQSDRVKKVILGRRPISVK
jgi:Ca-activated chloride channel family protein